MNEGMSPADVAAVTNHGCGYGNGWGNNGMFGMEWIFALLILPMLWGGNGPFGRGNGENPVTESGLCNAMNSNNLQNAVGRLSDVTQQGISTLGYESLNQTNALQRDLCTGLTGVVSAINEAARQQAECCCTTQRAIDGVNYNAAMNTAAINANTTATGQKVLDAICGLRMEMKDDRIGQMQNQINQLQLNAALCGVPRFQPGTVYGAVPANPFFGSWGNCCNNGCGNNI